MSLLSKLWKAVRPAVGAFVGGPVGAAIATSSRASKSIAQVPAAPARDVMAGGFAPGSGFAGTPAMARLPALRGNLLTPGGAGLLGLGGAAVKGAAAAMRSANVYCRRHPAWCAALPGGIAAVADMVTSGSLPPIKRRRSRGITGTELKNFRRVSGVLNKWCKTPPPTKPRRRSC